MLNNKYHLKNFVYESMVNFVWVGFLRQRLWCGGEEEGAIMSNLV